MDLYEIMKILANLMLVEAALKAYCLIQIRNDSVKHIGKTGWIVIILLITLVGPVLYLTIGREK